MAARRFVWMPPTLFGLVLLVFAISHIVPSDPARVMAGENAPPEQVEALRHQYGLDLPLPWQFARYVRDVATGNMGTSLFTQRPVAEDLWARLPATFELAICAITLAVVVGVPLGVVAALSRNSRARPCGARASPSAALRWRRSGWRSCCNCCSRCGSG